MIVQKQICDQLISETEQSLQRMGLDLYEIMQRALAAVEKWKGYYGPFQEVWNHASNREELTAFLLTGPDPSPEEMETVLTLIRTVPYLLRRSLQDAAKSLPPPPGGRPRELRPEQCKEICLQIGQLYGQGVELRDAQKRLAQNGSGRPNHGFACVLPFPLDSDDLSSHRTADPSPVPGDTLIADGLPLRIEVINKTGGSPQPLIDVIGTAKLQTCRLVNDWSIHDHRIDV